MENLSYYEDIFDTQPQFDLPLIGYEKLIDDISYYIRSGSMVFLEGDEGTGKTSISYQIIKRFRGHKKLIYLDCKKNKKKINIEHLLSERYGVFGKFLKLIPSQMILLLDNVDSLTDKNAEKIKYFFDTHKIRSVILTAKNFSRTNIPESIKHRIGKRIFTIPKLNSNSGVEILYSRIEKVDLMDDVTINKLYTYSDYNPKKFLYNCTKVFSHAEDKDISKIDEKDVMKIIKEH